MPEGVVDHFCRATRDHLRAARRPQSAAAGEAVRHGDDHPSLWLHNDVARAGPDRDDRRLSVAGPDDDPAGTIDDNRAAALTHGGGAGEPRANPSHSGGLIPRGRKSTSRGIARGACLSHSEHDRSAATRVCCRCRCNLVSLLQMLRLLIHAVDVKRPWIVAAPALFVLLLTPLGTTPVASATVPSITTVPIQVIHTSDGTVSYRSVGTGQPLVLIMGYSGSQDDWAPDFVNALAVEHRVIVFDNAGIGQTTMPAGTLSISEMANQTAALIAALGLKHPDVLGWSMGGMIAQALAVLHPADVRRLVLSATYSGNGKATSPSPANATALVNAAKTGDTNAIMALIFPANQLATQESAYISGVSGYPHFYQAPEALAVAQHAAITRWATGAVRAGHGHISAPTLIGDGANDVMTPPANVHKMVQQIHGAHSVIYPDAGHGFLFQDASPWAARINAFLR